MSDIAATVRDYASSAMKMKNQFLPHPQAHITPYSVAIILGDKCRQFFRLAFPGPGKSQPQHGGPMVDHTVLSVLKEPQLW
jgi:hypothetical protein